MILKITRDSVVRAVANGLKPAEIADRLRRHASHEVPANVLHEVRDWSTWVRRVTAATLAVLRCPDRDTADRVMGALKKQAERLNDTLVAVDKKLTAAERAKLQAQGIFVQGSGEAGGDPAEVAEEEEGVVVADAPLRRDAPRSSGSQPPRRGRLPALFSLGPSSMLMFRR